MNYSKQELINHSTNLLELIEDIVEYYCDEEQISGAKLSQFPVNYED